MSKTSAPRIRANPNVIVQKIDGETLVVIPARQRVHNLNSASESIFDLCQKSEMTAFELVAALKNSLPTTSEENIERIVLEALCELQAKELVISDGEFESSPTRRRALKVAGLLLPAIFSMTLVEPAAAGSINPSCTVNGKIGQCMPIGTTDPDQCCSLGLTGMVSIEFSSPIGGVCDGGTFAADLGSPNMINCAVDTGASGVVRCVAPF